MTNEANFQINARNTVANRSTPHLFLYPSATATLDRVYNFGGHLPPTFPHCLSLTSSSSACR